MRVMSAGKCKKTESVSRTVVKIKRIDWDLMYRNSVCLSVRAISAKRRLWCKMTGVIDMVAFPA